MKWKTSQNFNDSIEVDTDVSGEPDEQYMACRKLLSSVFLDAINDFRVDLNKYRFRRDEKGRFIKQAYYTEQFEEKRRFKIEARQWIFGNTLSSMEDRLTFEACCNHLNLNVDDVRRRLKESVAR